MGNGSPRTVIMDDCDPPCGCWEWNPCALQEQQVLLNVNPPFQSPALAPLNKMYQCSLWEIVNRVIYPEEATVLPHLRCLHYSGYLPLLFS